MTWKLVLDFETRSAVDIRKAGAWRYSEDPSTEVICLSFGMRHTEDVYRWEPIRLPEHRDRRCQMLTRLLVFARRPEIIFEAHNAGFEQAIWQNIMEERWGMPPIPPERWDDTQARALHMGLPAKLEHDANILGIEGKDMEGNKLLHKLSKPRKPRKAERKADPDWANKLWWHEDPEDLKRLGEYCDQDVRVERSLSHTLVELPADERRIWLLDQHVNQRGVRLDLDTIRSAKRVMGKVTSRINAEVADLTNGEVQTVNQDVKMADWIERQGCRRPSDFQKETVAQALQSETLAANYPTVRELFRLRQQGSKSSTAKLDTMLNAVCADGRARYLLQYQGAATTGRWAGRLIQPQNFPRGELGLSDPEPLIQAIRTEDPDLLDMMYGDAAQAVSDALRPMIMAEDGHEIVAGDFSAIEARVVLALAEQWDKVALLKGGHDVYCDMASTIFGYPVRSKKEHPAERQVGKNAVLGLGFQCGAQTFQDKFCTDRPLEFCEKVVNTYRHEWAPKVPQLWAGLEAAAVDACMNGKVREFAGIQYRMEGDWLTARLPSGRKLYYHGAHIRLRPMPWDEDDKRPGLFYYAFKYGQWRLIGTYGGHLAENTVQAVARDIMAEAMLAADRRGIPIILTVHDEIVAEPKRGKITAEGFEDLMVSTQPQWVADFGIPVAAEAGIGKRYGK